MIVLTARLGLAGIRRRLAGAVLAVLLVAIASATATLAWHTATVADAPWERTFAETNGAHVLVHGKTADVAEAAGVRGVAAAAGPVPRVITALERNERFGLHVVGVGATPPPIERPLLTEGRWLRSDREVVLERSFATVLGIRPGETLTVAATGGELQVRVAGLAVLAASEPYPDAQPGVAFASPALVAAVQPDPAGWEWTEALRLEVPDRAAAVALDAGALLAPQRIFTETWLDARAAAGERNRITSIVLSTFSVLTLVGCGLVLATIVAARAVARRREIGLLKAVGFTPGQVARLFVIEQLAVALVGGVAGAVAGAALTPLLVRRSAELLGGVPIDVDPLRLVVVVAGVMAVVAVVTLATALRGSRSTVVRTLGEQGSLTAGAGLARLVPLGGRLAVRLGLKQALTRPGRAAATTAVLALTVSALVAGLAMEATLRHETAVEAATERSIRLPVDPAGLAPGRRDPVAAGDATRDQIRPIVHGLNGLVLAIALGGLLASAALGVRERTRELGVLRAIGLGPREAAVGVATSQAAISLAATAVGIPLGLALFAGVYQLANGTTDLVRFPPWWQLALVAPAAALAILAVTAYPARRAIGLRVADALRHE